MITMEVGVGEVVAATAEEEGMAGEAVVIEAEAGGGGKGCLP